MALTNTAPALNPVLEGYKQILYSSSLRDFGYPVTWEEVSGSGSCITHEFLEGFQLLIHHPYFSSSQGGAAKCVMKTLLFIAPMMPWSLTR